ncbi:tRNA (adenosine(37)-N6)-threonylcarbamoyltransferase complex dimerization subunit type 1 TsaB [Glaciecola petra]|uniref:tRNA threonylcarbamoyladenosine biosynthesis protein TsaB n=1 Tax=Glaciecola petra TaxID=3075602 RepID=A0ABU2ZMU8_9ALTE|nr:tRNA (adenosine(37)-N6)-threonylcarbamoyltransferase complex dimerization subunit type 1 TsaB [Aestuariibacter sp. P117]MDT0593935.1 tRNA (adenosine(37)-N6)-threonylcarbamoyltransferase complex dimerization subunit type 1 TsaB [Aestuariibacter sp. P117]
MNILAIDTATEACSVALSIGSNTDSIFDICPQQHSQQILPMLDTILMRNNIKIADLDAIAYGRGPGSFTGVRIAASTVQGLALGSNLPVIEVSTLATLAQQNYDEYRLESTLALIDARMKEVYAGSFTIVNGIATTNGNETVIDPQLALNMYTQHKPLGIAGTGFEAYADIFSGYIDTLPKVMFPNALHMLPLAQYQFNRDQVTNAKNIEPVYVRDKVTWQKLPNRR